MHCKTKIKFSGKKNQFFKLLICAAIINLSQAFASLPPLVICKDVLRPYNVCFQDKCKTVIFKERVCETMGV